MRSASFAFFCATLVAQNRTLDDAAAIGSQIAEEVHRSTTPVEPQAVQDYVAQLGAKLTAQLPSRAFAYTFSVVNVDLTNALHEPLALPGGYIFVPLSLLLTAKDEGEFAGMLAQAIARGPLLIKNNAGTTGTIPLIFVGGFAGDSVLPAAAMEQRRGMELQADTSAALAMSNAGFEPAARLAALQGAILDLPPAAYTESDEFYGIQERARPAPPKPQSRPSLLRK